MAYDATNVFARILRKELPCEVVYENAFALAFNDINPQAPVHALVIPKGAYSDQTDFASNASDAEIAGFARAVATVAAMLGVEKTGYRLISNVGANGGQEVPHYHVHVLGGKTLGRMVGA